MVTLLFSMRFLAHAKNNPFQQFRRLFHENDLLYLVRLNEILSPRKVRCIHGPWRRETFPCNLSLFLDNVNTLSKQFAHKVFFAEKTKVIYKIVLCLLSRQYGVQKHNLIRAPKTSLNCVILVLGRKNT